MVRMVGWIVAVIDAKGDSSIEGSRAGGGYDGKRVLIRSVSAYIVQHMISTTALRVN